MNTNPINLGVRFLLELIMLGTLGYWGWHNHSGWLRYAAAAGLPVTAAAIWGIFRIPNDPKAAPVEVQGVIRLIIELGLFGAMVLAFFDMGYPLTGKITGSLVLIHYLLSYDRTLAMLQNKPYRGFVK